MFSGNFGDGLWIAFIGWFLENAAVAQVRQQMVQDRLAGHSVSQAMSRSYTTIPAGTTLKQLVDQHILGSGRRNFVVERGDEALGLLTLHNVKTIRPAERPTTTAAQAMIPLKDAKSVRPDAELWEALAEMDRDGVNQLPVMSNDHLQGMLAREDVVSFLRTLLEFGP
jgi:signal-transduction protein with cAMP-binding, CBS, and nucleotidyltransferase domain